jgi:hypothetical protein
MRGGSLRAVGGISSGAAACQGYREVDAARNSADPLLLGEHPNTRSVSVVDIPGKTNGKTVL